MRVLGNHRHALSLLAGSPDGIPVSLFLSHGVPAKCITTLVQAGFATTHPAQVIAGARVIEVVRYRVTDLGRTALRWPRGQTTDEDDDDDALRLVLKMALRNAVKLVKGLRTQIGAIDEDVMVTKLIRELEVSGYEIVKRPGDAGCPVLVRDESGLVTLAVDTQTRDIDRIAPFADPPPAASARRL